MQPDRHPAAPPQTDQAANQGRACEPWRLHAKKSHDRPPWWPNDLSWPPDERAWKQNRRRIFRRFAMSMAIFALVICMVGWIIASFVSGDMNHQVAPAKFVVILAMLFTALLTSMLIMGRVRKTLGSVVDVMEAADSVATGNYTARVAPSGPQEFQQLAISFNDMAERLEINDEQRRRLLADIAHELRTPLAVIQGTLEAVIDGVYPNESDRLEPLLAEVAVITRLLEDLQLLAHAEGGGLKLERSPTDLGALICDVRMAFEPQAQQRGVNIAEEIAPTPEIDVDPIRIRQVLENLLSNAIRYTPSGGRIAIRSTATGDGVSVEVEDSGSGMTDEERVRMFERFVKSADSGGSGLGLAIARSLVEAHGGTIEAMPAAGHGTIVRFTLPGDDAGNSGL